MTLVCANKREDVSKKHGKHDAARPPLRRERSRLAGVVNGRLRHAGKSASRRAPLCVVSRVGFYVLQTPLWDGYTTASWLPVISAVSTGDLTPSPCAPM